MKAAKQAVKTVTDKKTKVKTIITNVVVTATVTDAAGKKWSYSKGAGTVGGVVTGLVCTAKGVPVPSFGVTLGANGLSGEWGDFAVEGARNGMGTKGDAMMAALDANYKKSWSVTLTNRLGATRLQLMVGAKGSTKISGSTADGFKVSATVQGIMGEDAFFVPYLATLKNGKLTHSANLLLSLGKDGTVAVRTSDLGALKAAGPTTDVIEVQPYAESASSKGGEAVRQGAGGGDGDGRVTEVRGVRGGDGEARRVFVLDGAHPCRRQRVRCVRVLPAEGGIRWLRRGRAARLERRRLQREEVAAPPMRKSLSA